MEKSQFNFQLAKAAKSGDGDRYYAISAGKEWTVYFPQEISRPNGKPAQHINVEIEVSS